MSYILEALKKSDQERNRGSAPGLQTVHMPVARKAEKRHWWILLLVFALCMNAGLLLWWLQPWKSPEPELNRLAARQQTAPVDRQPSKPAANDRAAAASPSGNRATLSQPAAVAKNEQQKPALQTEAAVLDEQSPTSGEGQPFAAAQHHPADKADAPAGASEPAVSKSEAPGTQVPKPSRPAQTVSTPAPKASTTKREKKPVDLNTKQPEPAPAKSVQDKSLSKPESTSAVPAERLAELHAKALDEALTSKPKSIQPLIASSATAAQVEQLPGLKSLPINIQKEIPELALSFLVYASKPSERMVNINGQMMREGQEVAPGLKIEEITQEGAVFSYKGLRFRKGVL